MLIPRGLQLVLFCSPDCKSLILVSGIETLNHHNIIVLCVPHDANSVASEKQPLKGVLIRKKLLKVSVNENFSTLLDFVFLGFLA